MLSDGIDSQRGVRSNQFERAVHEPLIFKPYVRQALDCKLSKDYALKVVSRSHSENTTPFNLLLDLLKHCGFAR